MCKKCFRAPKEPKKDPVEKPKTNFHKLLEFKPTPVFKKNKTQLKKEKAEQKILKICWYHARQIGLVN